MLETERLILRQMNKNDIDSVFAMRRDADIMRFIREPQNLAETENWIRLVSSRWKTDKIGFCGVFEKTTGKFLGWCGVWRLAETNELEIGYAIAKDFWNRGYATEAAEIFLQYAFEHIKPDKITAVAEPENTPSLRVMEKIGMKFIKIGEFYDRKLAQYAITEKEFFMRERENAKLPYLT